MIALLHIVLLALLLLLIGIALLNRFTFPILDPAATPSEYTLVSVLVPARNEEVSIERCVRSLLAQSYRPLEVIVLDDDSQDNTRIILERLRSEHAESNKVDLAFRIESIRTPLPAGWLGKNRACDQLARLATGHLLIFVDADTYHSPDAISSLVAFGQKSETSFFSAVPKQIVGSFWERVIVPMAPFLYFSYLPNRLIPRRSHESLIAANGQVIAVTRVAYEKIGGHAALRNEVVEDVELARRAKRCGLRVELVNAREVSSCRMYRSLPEVYSGFSKNFFPGLGKNTKLLSLFLLQLIGLYVYPVVALACTLLSTDDQSGNDATILLTIVLSGFLLRGLSDQFFGMRWWQGLLLPLSALMIAAIGLNSWRLYTYGSGGVWKGRTMHIDT